jgi:hypothetical protein
MLVVAISISAIAVSTPVTTPISAIAVSTSAATVPVACQYRADRDQH